MMTPPPPPPRFIGIDAETFLIQSGRLAPKAVCFSTAERVAGGFATKLMLREEGVRWFREALRDPNIILVIHNAPFDGGVGCDESAKNETPDDDRPWLLKLCDEDPTFIALVFAAYRAGRIRCTIVRQKLLDIAQGMRKFRRTKLPSGVVVVKKAGYGLDDLIEHFYNEHLEKKDTWRLSYALLDGVPITKWPASAVKYAIGDSIEHLRVYEAQEREIAEKFGGFLPNQVEQQGAAFALHLMAMWGLRADAKAVDTFIGHCQEQIKKMQEALAETNILKKDGSRTMAEIRRRISESFARKGLAVPMTDPSAKYPNGQVKTDEDTLRLTDDMKLHVLADSLTFQKHLGQWGPVVRAAILRPVCCSYNILVDNGRTSCSGSQGQEGTNIQNPPRKGDVRPCFIPRFGWVYCSTDADTIEMRANAQNCYEMVGWSRMREALWDQHTNGGPDLHVRLGAAVAGISNEEAHALHKAGDSAFKNTRQMSKHGNFAFLGGAGAKRFAGMAHGFGICLTQSADYAGAFDDAVPVFVEEGGKVVTKWVSERMEVARAMEIKRMFLQTWPEEIEYFRMITAMVDSGRPVRQLKSGRIRGDLRFTSLSNSLFSGRVADAFKEILFNLAEECYTGRCTSKHIHGGDLCTVMGKSVLYGSRPAMFLHDEPILEHPELSLHERAEKQRRVVVDGLSIWMPDVPCTSAAVAMRRWQKGSEPLFVDGKLVPVKPEKVIIDGKSKIRWVQDFEPVLLAA